MIKKSLNNSEEEEPYEILTIPNEIVDDVIVNDLQVFLILNSWFKKHNFNIKKKQKKYFGTKSTINNVLSKFKTDPPLIPFRSYDIPESLSLDDVCDAISNDKIGWYVNIKNRKLVVPTKVTQNQVDAFYDDIDIIIISDDDDSIEEDDNDIESDDTEEEDDGIENDDDDTEEEDNGIENDDDDTEKEEKNCEDENQILIIPHEIIDKVLLNDNQIIKSLNSWFIKNNFEINGKAPRYIANKATIKKILNKFKKDPPRIPFKSYNIPKNIDIKDLGNKINKNKKYIFYLNESQRKLYAQSCINKNIIFHFIYDDEEEDYYDKIANNDYDESNYEESNYDDIIVIDDEEDF